MFNYLLLLLPFYVWCWDVICHSSEIYNNTCNSRNSFSSLGRFHLHVFCVHVRFSSLSLSQTLSHRSLFCWIAFYLFSLAFLISSAEETTTNQFSHSLIHSVISANMSNKWKIVVRSFFVWLAVTLIALIIDKLIERRINVRDIDGFRIVCRSECTDGIRFDLLNNHLLVGRRNTVRCAECHEKL